MTIGKREAPFTVRFIDTTSRVFLELTNTTDRLFKSVEILAVFLKDEETAGAPSRSHIKFDVINSIRPKETAVLSHRTWTDGQPADPEHDELERLKEMAGKTKPYVLDISWEDAEGRSQYQRIPVGH